VTSSAQVRAGISIDGIAMTNEPKPEYPHRRPHSPPLDGRYLELDLSRELDQLQREPEWEKGQNAKTVVKYDNLRVVLMSLKAHGRIPEHVTEGRITIQTIRGHILVRADQRTFDLPLGGLLALDHGLPHDVEAIEDSAFLLTIAWPPSGPSS